MLIVGSSDIRMYPNDSFAMKTYKDEDLQECKDDDQTSIAIFKISNHYRII